jgi:hypothetical protein
MLLRQRQKGQVLLPGQAEPAASTSGVPFPLVSEQFALRSLLASSRPFRAFYTTERSKIVAGMYWTDKLPMPPGIEVQAIRLPKAGPPVIYLQRIPAVPAAALAGRDRMVAARVAPD